MKTAQELYDKNYQGFTSTSVSDAYKKGFFAGVHLGREELRNMLEDVVNVLDLSDSATEEHGPMGTAPAELVRLVLKQKDDEIDMLKRGFVRIENTILTKFNSTSCSQCGGVFGPCDEGFSHCEDHQRVKIRYWLQETSETGKWVYTDKLFRRDADRLLSNGSFYLGKIVNC